MASISDEYEKLQRLGSGSFATIWKVRHKTLGYVRALKMSKEEVSSETEHAYQQFLKECTVLLKIGNGCHPNIVRIYQPRLLDGRASVEMDYVKGQTLNEYLQEKKCLGMDEFYRLFEQIGGALAYCHHDIYQFLMDPNVDDLTIDPTDGRRYLIGHDTELRLVAKYGVTHNDIHSNNVMRRDYDGSFVLLDFGLAIQDGHAVKTSAMRGGALEYMPPEKFDDSSVISTQSDIYSFGILMYEALAGRVPFLQIGESFSDQTAMYQQHKTGIPPSIEALRREAFEAAYPGQTYQKDFPDWLEQIIMKCLEKDPKERYEDAKEMMRDFKNYKEQEIEHKPNPHVQEAVLHCPSCGAEVTPNARYCHNCGENLVKKTKTCPNCGEEINEKDVFCASCGYSLKKTETSTSSNYVDLGLPSGTKWAKQNQSSFYTYDEAVRTFGDKLPTKKQFKELKDKCRWNWSTSKKGYNVVGPNGNSIFLPAAGYRDCYGDVRDVGSLGYYWSSALSGSGYAWYLYFNSGGVYVFNYGRCDGQSVRLVQD